MRMPLLTLLAVVCCLPACGLVGGVDPRCESLCVVKVPELSGAWDICSQASADRCKQDCNARIDGQASLCATCLLEKSWFGTSSSPSGLQCGSTGCTVDGPGGSCSYANDDLTARDNCYRQVYPRREVECTPSYRPVDGCAAICITK